MVGSIFCDLQKAFDSVNHDILLLNISHLAITGKAKPFFGFYLKEQIPYSSNYSRLNSNTVSEWAKIKHCVPFHYFYFISMSYPRLQT